MTSKPVNHIRSSRLHRPTPARSGDDHALRPSRVRHAAVKTRPISVVAAGVSPMSLVRNESVTNSEALVRASIGRCRNCCSLSVTGKV